MANDDLISRSELRNLFIEVMEHIKENPKMTMDEIHIICGCHMLCEMIDDAPAVDAVPVVRCKECKRRGTVYCPMLQEIESYDEDDGLDYWYIDNAVDDGFCHVGAKMDGGADA